MGRGRSSSGAGRGMSRSGSSGRGLSRSRFNSRSSGTHSHTTIFIGGGHGGHHISYGKADFKTLILMAVIFLAFGIGFSIFGAHIAIQNSQYATVQAECVDNDYIDGWYYSTYDYTINGKEYTNISKEGWEKDEIIGEIVTIYYLKSNPNVITEKEPNGNTGSGIIVVLFSLVFVGAGVLLIVAAIKSKKGAKQTTEQTTSSPEIIEEKSNKCPYCGSRYNRNSDSCPKCGASRID